MPGDAALAADARDWLSRATEDLEAARRLLAGGSPLPAQAAFHAQQAAEKALKAFLTWHKSRFAKTHDLGALGGACVMIDSTLADTTSLAAEIGGYAVEPRYPGSGGRPALADAQEALKIARQMYAAVISRLPDEARP